MKELKGIVLEHTRDKGFVCVCVCVHYSSFQLNKIKKKKVLQNGEFRKHWNDMVLVILMEQC